MEDARALAPNSRRYRLAAMLRGGSRPLNLALALVLGLAIGLTVGWNFTVFALLLLAALANVNSKLLAISTTAGALLAWLAGPVLAGIGGFIFDETPLGNWIGMLGDGPVVAMFDLDSCHIVGGLALVGILSVPLVRAAWQFGESRSIDPEVEAAYEREGMIRPQFWLVLPAVLLVAGVLPWWLGTHYLERRILGLLSDFNGAEVSATQIHLRPWRGELELDDLQVPDPANLERDRLRVGQVRAQLRSGPLLRGRLEIERLELTGVDRDVARRKAAKAVSRRIPQIRFSPAPLALPAEVSQELELHDYVRGWDHFAERLSYMGQLLAAIDRIRSFEPDHLQRNSAATLFGSPARSNLGSPQPALKIDHVSVERFGESWGLGPKSLVELTRLSTNPKLTKEPTSLRIVLPELTAEVQSTIDYSKAGQRHRVQVQLVDLPLVTLVERSSGGSRIAVDGGRLAITGEGWMDDSRFDLAVRMQLTNLEAKLQGSEPAAGITTETWNRGLENLGELRAELTCNGRWTSPRLHVQARDLVNQFKHQLRSAGDHNLLETIDEQLTAPAVKAEPVVIVTETANSPVELPHPLPNPDPPATILPAVPAVPSAEPLPQQATMSAKELPVALPVVINASAAPAAELAAPVAVVAPAPARAILVAGYPRTSEPADASAATSGMPPAFAQTKDSQPGAPATRYPTAIIAPAAQPVISQPVTPAPQAVAASDALFGPPTLAIPAVGQEPIDRSAPSSSWQSPRMQSVPTYAPPPGAPIAIYTPPPATKGPTYSPPAIAVPTEQSYYTSKASTNAAPQANRDTNTAAMPGPVNLQTGLDPSASQANSSAATASPTQVASQRTKATQKGVPTPRQSSVDNPPSKFTFFRKSTKPPAAPADKAVGDGTSTAVKVPWYKKLL